MTESARPLVSVIIPSFNYARYLVEAIDSVLAQSYSPVEIIVVDDGSTDDSVEIARGYGDSVRLIESAHGGPSRARNLGVAAAQGEFLAFLDSDDRWDETKLSRQMAAFANDQPVDIVLGLVRQFYSPELDAHTRAHIACPEAPQPGYHAGAMLIRRDTFERVGPFEERWRVGEFIAWYARAQDLGLQTLMLPSVVMYRRLHADNQTRREREILNDYTHILKGILNRRRDEADSNAAT